MPNCLKSNLSSHAKLPEVMRKYMQTEGNCSRRIFHSVPRNSLFKPWSTIFWYPPCSSNPCSLSDSCGCVWESLPHLPLFTAGGVAAEAASSTHRASLPGSSQPSNLLPGCLDQTGPARLGFQTTRPAYGAAVSSKRPQPSCFAVPSSRIRFFSCQSSAIRAGITTSASHTSFIVVYVS